MPARLATLRPARPRPPQTMAVPTQIVDKPASGPGKKRSLPCTNIIVQYPPNKMRSYYSQIFRSTERSARVALEKPMQTKRGILKKGQILNIRNRGARMKRLIDVSEAREICKDRTV
ncbi:hypothetical protein EVAR_85437_1 [Eumeta japonica]|uniref:Uncharacterized protein n=1 Tax=Eumeta variegata TaxID=151549 RepID=A0A4C1WM71_EUMVA|nr:hypothetical protein EVAR_85437_1 [Eumeta japonica]